MLNCGYPKVSLSGLKRWRKWGTFFKKSSDPYVKVAVGGAISSDSCMYHYHYNPSSGIAFESKVHYMNLNPEFKFVCEIPVSNTTLFVCSPAAAAVAVAAVAAAAVASPLKGGGASWAERQCDRLGL